MKIVFAGCTGFIGTKLVNQLAEDGHACTVLIRTSTNESVNRFPENVRLAPYSDMPDTAEAVFNFAGEPIVGRWNKQKMAKIIDTRVDITRHLVEWMEGLSVKPAVFLSASAVGFYGDRGEELITEETGPDPNRNFRCQVCIAWEGAANEARKAGIRVVNMRIGNVIDPSGGMLQMLRSAIKFLPVVVPHARSAYIPWISLDDVVGICRFSLLHESVSGPINVVAPTNATWAQFYEGLGAIMRKPVVGQVPKLVLKLKLGKFAQALLESQRILPEKIVHEGYSFQDANLDEYLRGLRPS